MYYSIRHLTRFIYDTPVRESVMEVRTQPRSEGHQRCLSFELTVQPRARIMAYRDHLGNVVHHFDIPAQHEQLTITAEALVDLATPPDLPDVLDADMWERLDQEIAAGDFWEWLQPSHFARPSALLHELAAEFVATRRDDPLTVLRELNSGIYNAFSYSPQSTRVDSPIDDALRNRKGVCQDYAHIMIALVRELGIPCRYVSGYLFHRVEDADRSAEDATHAWVEAWLPDLGWIGFDPTNNLIAKHRHIRAAVGRDYNDVPPTRGVYKGGSTSELEVAVQVLPADGPPPDIALPPAFPVAGSDMVQAQQQQ